MVATKLFALIPLLGAVALAAPSTHGRRTNHLSEAAPAPAWDSGYKYSAEAAPPPEHAAEPAPAAHESAPAESKGWEQPAAYQAGGWKEEGAGWESVASATTIVHETTLTTHGAYETPKHGSGSQYGGDLQSCLNMCHAQFGGGSIAPPAEATAPPAETTAPPAEGTAATKTEGGEGGGGATHTVIVAPTKGVLRFVPFAIEGKEGDTVEFVWGAGPHTVTLSDGQNVCNKSTGPEAFDSGKLNATATFTTKIKSSSPQFHYCTVGTHCTAGMFGIINPPKNDTPPAAPPAEAASSTSSAERPNSTAGQGGGVGGCESVDCWVNSYAAADTKSKETVDAVKAACNSTPEAWAWGGAWQMTTLLSPSVTKESVVENMLYSRLMISMNPGMMDPNTPLGNNFVAPPPLNEFVAASPAPAEAAPAQSSSAPDVGAGAGAGGEAAATDAAASASASGSAEAEAANAGSSTSGAGRVVVASTLLVAMAYPVLLLLL